MLWPKVAEVVCGLSAVIAFLPPGVASAWLVLPGCQTRACLGPGAAATAVRPGSVLHLLFFLALSPRAHLRSSFVMIALFHYAGWVGKRHIVEIGLLHLQKLIIYRYIISSPMQICT